MSIYQENDYDNIIVSVFMLSIQVNDFMQRLVHTIIITQNFKHKEDKHKEK